MPRLCNVFRMLLVVCCAAGLLCGCTKSRQKMKPPDIKSITPENLHGIIAPDDRHIWLTGNYGVIFHSADGGATWKRQESGVKEPILIDGIFLNEKVGWIVGIYGVILHTTDGGATWTRQDSGTRRHLFGIAFADPDNGWAVGEWSTILHTGDGGRTWKPQGEENDKIYNHVCFVDRMTGWIVGERGTILHTTDAGATWNVQMPKAFERENLEDELVNPRPSLFSVQFLDHKKGWACGIDGVVLKTENGGRSWDILSTGTDLTLQTIFVKGDRGYAVGDKGAYVVSEDGGDTWRSLEGVIKSKFSFRDVFFSSPDNGWVVGASGTVVHTADGGTTWEFYSGLSYAMTFFEMPKALEFGGGTE